VLIKPHADGVKVVISGWVSGDGGEFGQELLASLTKAIEKYTADEIAR